MKADWHRSQHMTVLLPLPPLAAGVRDDLLYAYLLTCGTAVWSSGGSQNRLTCERILDHLNPNGPDH